MNKIEQFERRVRSDFIARHYLDTAQTYRSMSLVAEDRGDLKVADLRFKKAMWFFKWSKKFKILAYAP